jgi:hypothetical protein
VPKVKRFASPRGLSIKLFNFLTVIVPVISIKQTGIPKYFGRQFRSSNLASQLVATPIKPGVAKLYFEE